MGHVVERRAEGNPAAIGELLRRREDRLAGRSRRRERRIRCPLCAWQPRKHDLWLCTYCGHHWNTFDTAGLCPGCQYQWQVTACLSCHRYSPHRDWYEESSSPDR